MNTNCLNKEYSRIDKFLFILMGMRVFSTFTVTLSADILHLPQTLLELFLSYA